MMYDAANSAVRMIFVFQIFFFVNHVSFIFSIESGYVLSLRKMFSLPIRLKRPPRLFRSILINY